MTIPKLILDPQNVTEMLTQMAQRTQAASRNTLTDFSPASPVAAIFEGQAYATAELLYFLNKLPEATALEVLRLAGVSRRPGTYATGRLEFSLDLQLADPYFLPTGFTIPDGSATWILTEDLYINPGARTGSVGVRSGQLGAKWNRAAYQVNIGNTQLSYVRNIQNLEPISGGTDLETLAELLVRSQEALRSRKVLVSAVDYELRAQDYLGSGSKATCIPLLAANKTTEKAGHVHIFLQGSDGLPPNTQTCQEIQQRLRDDSFAAASVWVSPVEQLMIWFDVVIDVATLDNGRTSQIFKALTDYLSPQRFKLGSPIVLKEVEFFVRQQPGVLGVPSVLIQNSAVNLAMPNKYTQPWLGSIRLYQTDLKGKTLTTREAVGWADPE